MKLQTKSLILAAALTAPFIANAGLKVSNTEQISIPVSYQGYDLNTVTGKAMVVRKIERGVGGSESAILFVPRVARREDEGF